MLLFAVMQYLAITIYCYLNNAAYHIFDGFYIDFVSYIYINYVIHHIRVYPLLYTYCPMRYSINIP